MKRLVIRLVHLLDQVLPKRDKLVLRGEPDVEDQCLAVLFALARRGHRRPIVWLMRSPCAAVEPLLKSHGLDQLRLTRCPAASLAGLWHFVTARLVMFTHGCYSQGDWGNYPPPRRKTVVNLWHGMPIKAIWGYLPEPTEAPQSDLLPATSPSFRKIMARASGMDESEVKVLGLPRNDLLTGQAGNPAPAAEAVCELVGDRRWLLHLPTYRKSTTGYVTEDGREHDSVLAMSDAEVEALDEWLEANSIAIVVKAHPMSVHANHFFEQRTANIAVISDRWLLERRLTLYLLAARSDGLVTDLSSIAVDYLLLDRPVFIHFPDRDEYLAGRGMVFDSLENNLPGPVCADTAGLIRQLDAWARGEDPAATTRARLLADWHSFTTGSAADRLLDVLMWGG